MSEIITIEQNGSPIASATAHYQMMVQFVKQSMREGQDYGIIPGTNNKPTLLKPGAEKLCRLFQLAPHFDLVTSVVDFDKPLFHYHYRCTLKRHGEPVGQGEGCCNSYEKKYEKQRHKIYDLTNTICKMAQKRALLASVLVAVGASEFFTQDMDEEEDLPVSKKHTVSTNGLISDAQVKRFRAIATTSGYTPDGAKALLRQYGLASSKEITKQIYDRICEQAGDGELAIEFNSDVQRG